MEGRKQHRGERSERQGRGGNKEEEGRQRTRMDVEAAEEGRRKVEDNGGGGKAGETI